MLWPPARVMETGLSVFNQALKYLELERTVNYGSAIIKYYDLKKDDVLIIFHNTVQVFDTGINKDYNKLCTQSLCKKKTS